VIPFPSSRLKHRNIPASKTLYISNGSPDSSIDADITHQASINMSLVQPPQISPLYFFTTAYFYNGKTTTFASIYAHSNLY
jgi:hypothetical protein